MIKLNKLNMLHPLISALVCLPLVLGATNWPVFFEHLGNVHSIHNKWDLSLSIDTRITEFEVCYNLAFSSLSRA